jgi:CRP/FNR family transcriptional regulator, cyclic AMP receptor protein
VKDRKDESWISQHYLAGHPLFSQLEPIPLARVASVARIKSFREGEVIFSERDEMPKIYILVQGKVKLGLFDGHEKKLVKDLLVKGDYFGDIMLSGDQGSSEFAQVLAENTVVCFFYVQDFRKILEQHPLLAISFLRMLGDKLRLLELRHLDLAFRDARHRLLQFLRFWARLDGLQEGNCIVLSKYLTHSDIGEFIATSRQSVHSLLKDLQVSGIIDYDREKIVLHDQERWNWMAVAR